MFKKLNINPKNNITNDCVIRAIAKAENKSWYEVFDVLSGIARDYCSSINGKDVYGKYLAKYPNINVKIGVNGNRRRYTVKDICRLQGTYIIQVASHFTVVIDGIHYDTWDCGHKSAYKIWQVK